MKKSILRSMFFLVCVSVLIPLQLSAQRTGNIVEIFGKEKVEETNKGIILHKFTEALLLQDAMIPGMLTAGQDILFWQITTGRLEKPAAGLTLRDKYKDQTKPLQWKYIEADSTGMFRGELNRGYLYTEFDSPEDVIALLDATGHTRVYINGVPHEGDHYDYAWTLIPFHLKKGLNQFIYTYGRFPRISSMILSPAKEVHFLDYDLTLPSVIIGEKDVKWGAVRVMNATKNAIKGLNISCTLETGENIVYQTDDVMALGVRKIKFMIPAPAKLITADSLMATLVLSDKSGAEIDRMVIKLNVKDNNRHYERTFLSKIDGSVQYYSVAPSLSTDANQAFVLSVHGASVEAVNQSRAYRQKDWAYIVAPTNRRPFGFNWEEWGRMDALEVLENARQIYKTDPSRTYLVGHSMGGHGSWYLGATYPDKWAAIAPAAGYPDVIAYRRTGTDSLLRNNPHFEMMYRGALAGRTVDLALNYLQSGVYVLHGDADAVVPVEQARRMRGILGGFHNNFCYYEYPGGSHWYGDHSVDWPPLFDFLKQNTIPALTEVDNLEFITASPGVSSTNYWIQINQQITPYQHSKIKAVKHNDTINIKVDNINGLTVFASGLNIEKQPVIIIDEQIITGIKGEDIILKLENDEWGRIGKIDAKEKYPQRYGGFKLAFDNNVVFVYATNGSKAANEWYYQKALYDAETFLYRGNSSVDVISDREFSPEKYKDRNVIIYGNADNHIAWNMLLGMCPVKVNNDGIKFGKQFYKGDDLGALFVYPRADSEVASVGVVAGTGEKGMMAAYTNEYFSGITGFPDLMIFNTDWIKDGLDGVKISGFFGYDWSIEKGQWRGR